MPPEFYAMEEYWTPFFEEYQHASLERQLELARLAIDDGPGFDGETAFHIMIELEEPLRSDGRSREFDELLDRITARHPDVAAEEAHYFWYWRLVNALNTAGGDVLSPTRRLAEMAGGQHFDMFTRGFEALLYHGRADEALLACQTAWPLAAHSETLLPDARYRLHEWCVSLALDAHVEQVHGAWNPDEFASVVESYSTEEIKCTAGRWWNDMARARVDPDSACDGKTRLAAARSPEERLREGFQLTLEFAQALHARWDWPRCKATLARHELDSTISTAITKSVEKPDSRRRHHRHRSKRCAATPRSRCSDPWLAIPPADADRAVVQCLQGWVPTYYHTGAFIQALPRWWQFLAGHEIVSPDEVDFWLADFARRLVPHSQFLERYCADPVVVHDVLSMQTVPLA